LEEPDAVSVTLLPEQIAATGIIMGGFGSGTTVAITSVRVLSHTPLLIVTQNEEVTVGVGEGVNVLLV
jgi:hypothetical protein